GFSGVLARSRLRSFSRISGGMFVVVSDGGFSDDLGSESLGS
ncbi:hypothetical protein A2U01_0095096, partial [Trifolium medium]|nr:hypothetical protein [Trifolium medium]